MVTRKSRTPKKDPEDNKITEVDGIPTAYGLSKMGNHLARPYQGTTTYIITDEGHALLGQMLRDRAKQDLANGVWHGIAGRYPGGKPGRLSRDEGERASGVQ